MLTATHARTDTHTHTHTHTHVPPVTSHDILHRDTHRLAFCVSVRKVQLETLLEFGEEAVIATILFPKSVITV